MKENIISFSGVDGSGKSTVARLLAGLLRHHNDTRPEIVWFRWRALTLYALYLYSRFRGLYVRVYVPWLKRWIGIHVFHIDPVARRLYPYLLFIDLTVFYILHRLLWWIIGVKTVVFDRFYLDALIDAVYTCRFVDRFFLSLYIAMQEREPGAVVLDVDVDTAVARKRDIVSRREVEFKRRLYSIMARNLNIPVVDARQELPQVLSNVCRALNLSCYRYPRASVSKTT
jgi:energy-coupling factor transporter ATP-binding protein EcfA2